MLAGFGWAWAWMSGGGGVSGVIGKRACMSVGKDVSSSFRRQPSSSACVDDERTQLKVQGHRIHPAGVIQVSPRPADPGE